MMETALGFLGMTEGQFWSMTSAGYACAMEGALAARGIETSRARSRRRLQLLRVINSVPDRCPSVRDGEQRLATR